jgi:hypothetical protein
MATNETFGVIERLEASAKHHLRIGIAFERQRNVRISRVLNGDTDSHHRLSHPRVMVCFHPEAFDPIIGRPFFLMPRCLLRTRLLIRFWATSAGVFISRSQVVWIGPRLLSLFSPPRQSASLWSHIHASAT